MYLAIVLLIVVIAWDFGFTLSGLRSEFTDQVRPIRNVLIPTPLEQHLNKFTIPVTDNSAN